MDPLSSVYTGQDNSGQAAILNNGTLNPTTVLLGLYAQDREHKMKLDAAKQLAAAKQKQTKPADIPIPNAAPTDTAYFTKRRNEIIAEMQPLYDGTLDNDTKAALQQDIQMKKGKLMMDAFKSAKLHADAQSQIEDYNKQPYSYYPETEKQIVDWYNTPLDERKPIQLKRRNEKDYRASMEGVAVSHNPLVTDTDIGNGRQRKSETLVWNEANNRAGYNTWKSNKSDPNVMAFYDHAEEEWAKQSAAKDGIDFNQLDRDQKDYLKSQAPADVLDKMGYEFFTSVQKAKFPKVSKEDITKGDKVKTSVAQKKLSEMKDIQYDNTYNTKTKAGIAKGVTAYTIVHPKKAATVLTLSPEMYDTETKTKIKDSGSVTFTPGQIQIGVHWNQDAGTKIWEPMVAGTYETKEKNPKSGYTETVKHSILVPLSQVEGALDAAGEQYKWAYELADQKNAESLTPNTNTKFDYSNLK